MTSTLEEWAGDSEAKPAPGPLRRVQAFINTIDLESGQDRLRAVEDARPWLVANELLASDAPLREDDLRTVVAFREGLRALVIQNTDGQPPAAGTVSTLNEIAGQEFARVTIAADGGVRLAPIRDDIRGRLLTMLLDIADAQCDGTWVHMKACANDDCLWAFYDRSRNHGGTWCDMATCGNKLKNRDFRARRRTAD
jgi:predicted RNA-binding Zn ribbon-like protein